MNLDLAQFTMKPILSILTPAIPSRTDKLSKIVASIEEQRLALFCAFDVEHLVFLDTQCARTVGQKRDNLVQLANGQYVAFLDDDDLPSPDYLSKLLSAIKSATALPDVITFRQSVIYCGQEGEVSFGLGNPNESFAPGKLTRRAPWHVCAFRSELAKAHHFPHVNYGEDWAWARHVGADCKTSVHIDAILHTYIHNPATTAAPQPT